MMRIYPSCGTGTSFSSGPFHDCFHQTHLWILVFEDILSLHISLLTE